MGNSQSTVYYLISDLYTKALAGSSTRKKIIAKAIRFCYQVNINSEDHFNTKLMEGMA